MGPCRVLSLLLRSSGAVWERPFPASHQRLRIERHVLRYVRNYRQSKRSSVESGGAAIWNGDALAGDRH